MAFNFKEKLDKFYGVNFILADREFVESNWDEMIERSKDNQVVFWVVGDPFGATTHTDLFLRCSEAGVEVKVIHNASIINAVGVTGLQLYRFGEIISIPFFTEKWKPYSFAEKIQFNMARGLHTLCLLDIKVKEPTEESLCSKYKEYMPPRFMSISTAVDQLLEAARENGYEWYNESTKCFGLARVGADNQKIVAAELGQFKDDNTHSVILNWYVFKSNFLFIFEFSKIIRTFTFFTFVKTFYWNKSFKEFYQILKIIWMYF